MQVLVCLAPSGCHSRGEQRSWDCLSRWAQCPPHATSTGPTPLTAGWARMSQTQLTRYHWWNRCQIAVKWPHGWDAGWCLCAGCGWGLDSATFPACFSVTRLVEAWEVGRTHGWLGGAGERFKWSGGNWVVSPDFVVQLMNVSLRWAFVREIKHYNPWLCSLVFSSRFTRTWQLLYISLYLNSANAFQSKS